MNHKYTFVALLLLLGSPVTAMAGCEHDPEYNRGVALSRQEKFREAIALWRGVEQRDASCMGVKFEMALAYFKLGEFDKAKPLFLEVKNARGVPLKVARKCEGHLQEIQQIQQMQDLLQAGSQKRKTAFFRARAGLGLSDNVNGGARFGELTFGHDGFQVTLPLSDKSKAQAGSWHDMAAVYRNVLPSGTGLDGDFQLTGNWCDYHGNNNLNFGVIAAETSVHLGGGIVQTADPHLIVSGSSISLGGNEYRRDVGVGIQLQPKIKGKKLIVRYRFNNSDYRSVDYSDGTYHKLSLTLPVDIVKDKAQLGVDAAYQWPASTERLLDYREASLKLRLGVAVTPRTTFSTSYGISKQKDNQAYNQAAFGDQKRDLQQQELGVGLGWKAGKHLTYEGRLQTRKADSGVKLFDTSATEATFGVSWQAN